MMMGGTPPTERGLGEGSDHMEWYGEDKVPIPIPNPYLTHT